MALSSYFQHTQAVFNFTTPYAIAIIVYGLVQFVVKVTLVDKGEKET